MTALSPLPVFRVQRLEHATFATYGQWLDSENRELCKTLELPWLNNTPDKSCIPVGAYHCTKTLSPRLGYVTPELQGVPDRADIRAHIGCLPCDVEGCIAVGTTFGFVEYPDRRPNGTGHGVLGSHDAFKALMAALPDEFMLDVLDPPDEASHAA